MDTKTAVDMLNHDPLAQELLTSSIPGRLAYVAEDGTPRSIPIGFYWTGEQLVMATDPSTPKVSALMKNPAVAMTIDTNTFPPHVLLVRGTVTIEIVEGIPPEYLEASRKVIPAEGWSDFEAGVRATYSQMARIAITPQWVKLMDFETRVPDFLANRANPSANPAN
jgi:hypothetical protein